MSSDKNMSPFRFLMLWNLVVFTMLIYFLALVVAEKLRALALWLALLIAKKAQPLIHAENANPVLI
jgi:hypothetical protein